jgi:replicative DNA helicase
MTRRKSNLRAVPPQDAPPVGDERTLPHNLEAERSVLGAILVDNSAFELASREIKADDFYRDAHRRIYSAIVYLVDERRVVVDFVTLKEELGRRNEIDEVGGPAYIASLADGVPRATNTAYYARIVREKATLRNLIYAANKILKSAYECDEEPEDLLRTADRLIVDVTNGHGKGRLESVRDSISPLMRDLEYRIEHRGELTGVPTGFDSVNLETMGWQPGDLIIIAARPSIGKTTFVVNSLVSASEAGKRTVLFSLEMRKKQLHYRLLSHLSGVDLSRIISGAVGSVDYAKISAALERMHALDLHIDDRSGQTYWDIRAQCRRLKAEHGLDLVAIDYVQLMAGSLERKGANRNEEVTDISRRLKILADELGVPILLLSQLSRAGSKRSDPRPQLSDLRESGSLEQDADVVAFLHRKNHKEGGYTEFILEKQRNGPTGSLALTFHKETSTFVDGGDPPPAPERKRKGDPDPRLPVDQD